MDYNLQIHFRHFGHSAADLFLHMLRKVCIFSGHLPEEQDCFPSGILDTPRKCITFDIIVSDISDIQQLIYLCTCSGSSAFFQVICLGTRAAFFSDIPDTPRTCITFDIFISDISDIQQFIYFRRFRILRVRTAADPPVRLERHHVYSSQCRDSDNIIIYSFHKSLGARPSFSV